jgi:Flp pilus assembly protein TadD
MTTILLIKPIALFEQPLNTVVIKRQWLIILLIVVLSAAVGCTPGNTINTTNPATMKVLPAYISSTYLDNGELHKSKTSKTIEGDDFFAAKDYAQALKNYKIAIELAPSESNAWFGLAASADMLGQFDISDLAYKHLKTTHQNSAKYLNNLGYSHMLRGNLLVAREHFVKVFDLDPNNEVTQSNLDMLKHLVKNRPYDEQN